MAVYTHYADRELTQARLRQPENWDIRGVKSRPPYVIFLCEPDCRQHVNLHHSYYCTYDVSRGVQFSPATWKENTTEWSLDWERFVYAISEYCPDAPKMFATAKILFDLVKAGPGVWYQYGNGQFATRHCNWNTQLFREADLDEVARKACPKLFGDVGKLAFGGEAGGPFEVVWSPVRSTLTTAKEIVSGEEPNKDFDIPVATVVKTCVLS